MPSRRSLSVDGRTSPVSPSSVFAAQPLTLKNVRDPSRTTSCAGVSPAMRRSRGHAATARSTSSAGKRTTPVSSTAAPASRSTSSTAAPFIRMPTLSRIESASA